MFAEIRSKDQYGKTVFHPVNETATTFAEIAGTKTLTRHTIKGMIRLGVTVHIDNREIVALSA